MPCDSSYMNPTTKEKAISQVACLLDELDGKKWSAKDWEGYHPKVYAMTPFQVLPADELVAELCSRLKKVDDITKYSLEMQMWWRDHQKADSKRAKARNKSIKLSAERMLSNLETLLIDAAIATLQSNDEELNSDAIDNLVADYRLLRVDQLIANLEDLRDGKFK